MAVKEDDIVLWKRWKRNKSPENTSALVNQLLPLVKRDAYRYSSNIPYAIAEAHAIGLIIQACEAYNLNSGVALATFVKSYMIKLTQMGDAWRSPIRIPANRAYKFNMFKNTVETLGTNLGREPTIDELADELKWSKAEVTRFIKELRKEFSDDRPFMTSYNPNKSKEEEMIDFIYHDLTAREKILFERTTGYGGKDKVSNPKLAKILKINQNQLSYEKRKLVDKIERLIAK